MTSTARPEEVWRLEQPLTSMSHAPRVGVRADRTEQVTIGPFSLPVTAAERAIIEKFELVATSLRYTVERQLSTNGKAMQVVAREVRP